MPNGIAKKGFRKARADKGMKRGQRDAKVAVRQALMNGPQGVIEQKIEYQYTSNEIVETDEQIEARISERFEIMGMMAEATGKGKNRSLIISGPPGVGKSHKIEQMMEEMILQGRKADHVKGFIRPTGLFKKLYENRGKDCLIVFDDCDSVFLDDICLNLLKTACDTTHKRMISWLAETRMEFQGEQIPTKFEFEGSVIFITNYDFDHLIKKGHRLAPHFEALISRSHYLDLTLKSRRDYLVRIKQVILGGMFDKMNMKMEDAEALLDYIETNAETLRELSLRMVVKIAALMRSHPLEWERMARATCMK